MAITWEDTLDIETGLSAFPAIKTNGHRLLEKHGGDSPVSWLRLHHNTRAFMGVLPKMVQ